MDTLTIGLVGIAALILLLMAGIHVAVAMAVVGFAGFFVIRGDLQGTLNLFSTMPFHTTAVFAFSTLPLFILMGHFMFHGGITRELYDAAYKWMGRLPGGLAIATTFAAAAFAAACGASLASAATFTQISLPEMLKHGYDKRLASGCIAAAGTLAIMIPPSGAMVIYGIITGTSIGRLFIAGVIPGLISTIVFSTVVFVRVKMNPDQAPLAPERFTLPERLRSLKGVWGIAAILLIVMGGIYTGIFTPTEAGAVGAFGAFVICGFKGGLKGGALQKVLLDSGRTTSMIFLMIIGALIFGRFLSISQLGPKFTSFIVGLDVPSVTIIAGFMLMYLFLGMFLEGVAMQTLTLPVIFPVVIALGYSDVWFGVLIVKVVELALMTPPVGLNCYVVASVASDKVKLEEVFRGVFPFVIGDMATLTLLVAFPALSLWLPGKMFS